MSTPNRTEINRANAQHSTGPTTEAGKRRSSLNALRHGLTGQTVVMASDDLEAYEFHVETYIDEYKPKGATEAGLVQVLADTAWRLNRVFALETNVLSLDVDGPTPFPTASGEIQSAMAVAHAFESQAKALAILSLHGQRLSRQLERTIVQLRDLQQARRIKEHWDLKALVKITELYKAKGETYHPSADGFVFSDTEIQAFIQAQKRQNLAFM